MSPLPGSKRAGWEKYEQGSKNSISVAARVLDRVNLQKKMAETIHYVPTLSVGPEVYVFCGVDSCVQPSDLKKGRSFTFYYQTNNEIFTSFTNF